VADAFGTSLALSDDGNTLAVGASGEASNATGIGGNQNDNSASDSGAAHASAIKGNLGQKQKSWNPGNFYVFARIGNTWSQQAYIKASNTGAGDGFGTSLSLSADGNTLAVIANDSDNNAIGIGGDQGDNTVSEGGAVYVFTRTGTFWTQQAYIKASNTGANDGFGTSLSLSADGNTLAVIANDSDNNAIGIGGDQGDNTVSEGGAAHASAIKGNLGQKQKSWNPANF
jgi:hypothetical protein